MMETTLIETEPTTQTEPIQTEHLTIEMDVTADQKSAILNFFQAMNFPVQVQEPEEDDDEPVMTREEIIADLKEGIEAMKLHKQGRLELRSLSNREEINAFLNEL